MGNFFGSIYFGIRKQFIVNYVWIVCYYTTQNSQIVIKPNKGCNQTRANQPWQSGNECDWHPSNIIMPRDIFIKFSPKKLMFGPKSNLHGYVSKSHTKDFVKSSLAMLL